MRRKERYIHARSGSVKKGTEALVGGRVRKVASKDLEDESDGASGGSGEKTLWPGTSSVTACGGGTPFSMTGAAGASDMVRGTDTGRAGRAKI